MEHLNSFLASEGGNFPKIFQKFKCLGGCPGGGMFKLRFDWYISSSRDRKGQSYPVEYCLESVEEYSECTNHGKEM